MTKSKSVPKLVLSSSRDIPFSQLVLSQKNVRRLKAGLSIEDLAEDIYRRTLLQSLNVRAMLDEDGKETGFYEVPAGGRRFRALELLVKTRRMAKDQPVPCVVREAGIAEEDSLAENVMREGLHPLDQFRAFSALIEAGLSEDDIAARFFVSVSKVRQRLRLASVAPSLLEVYGEDDMTLEQLMAFTVNNDHARQEQVWDQVKDTPYISAHQIRRMLTEDAIPAGDRRVRFIGIDAYSQAGGYVMRDLFSEQNEGWLQDPVLVEQLVNAKLATAAEEIGAEGWKWVEAAIDLPYGCESGKRRITGTIVPLTDEEQARLDALVEEYDAIGEEYQDGSDLPDEVDARLTEIDEELTALNIRPVTYDPDEQARAGVFVSLTHDGRLRIDRGYVRPEDEPAVEGGDTPVDREGAEQSSGPSISVGGHAPDETAGDDEDDAIRTLPDRLVSELTAVRTVALRNALAGNPQAAFIAVLHALCLSVFRSHGTHGCVQIEVTQAWLGNVVPDLRESPWSVAIHGRHEQWSKRLPDEPGAMWDSLVELSQDEQMALLAHCVSLGVNALFEPVRGYDGRTSAHGIEQRIAAAEPSAGTGLLALQAELAGSQLALNEVADVRHALLRQLFDGATVTGHDAAQIHDRLDADLVPSCIVMNPPFSAALGVDTRVVGAAFRHIASALARLADGGRLVTMTGSSCAPDHPTWHDSFVRLQEKARVVFTAPIAGSVYASHGTTFETRLTVIDRLPAGDPGVFPPSRDMAADLQSLLQMLVEDLPPRAPVKVMPLARSEARSVGSTRRAVPEKPRLATVPVTEPTGVQLDYDTVDWAATSNGKLTDALYEPYALQSIRIAGAKPHPTRLVQSAAMASVAPPRPSYRLHLPEGLVEQGLLSDAQLESVIYAGEAHSSHLAGSWTVDATYDKVEAAPDDCETSVRFRKGWFLGDGTGAGKGRQVAGVLLDNWLKGRRRAVWISKSDKLLEDAQRDWRALGQEPLLIQPLARFRQGTPIRLKQGILFTTYATLRSDAREGRVSRVQQIVDWLGTDFDGVIVFDESHAMQNAGGGKSDRGDSAPSQQGRAGLRLQHALPDARVLYVSATGATTVENLAYAQRLGLWGGADFPFDKRTDFVAAIEAGGVAAMEVLARDLKALGLYAARSLSYEGVEYELVEHKLTPDQVRIYDAYAGAFQVIHNNLDAALEAAGVTSSSEGTLNRQAKSAARSAFESAKQRFFNHLITAMKTPTLIAAIEQGLADGHAAVVQIVSTGEALLSRRLADIDPGEWNDIQCDVTPREYVLDYLLHSFPTQLHETYTDGDGNLASRPAYDGDGNVIQCREACQRRDRLIEQLAAMQPVQGALDQIVQRFGTDMVAEVTGRSRRIVRKVDAGGERFAVENRPAHANLAEAQAFMEDKKQILVFSDAGGTGRSYHADLGSRNQRLRHHYLLEAGWKADTAIQGLGRTNRTNQAQPPLFRPVATDVQAEKRFLSTIARRLDTLGAITRGQRQTGGQGLFRPEDNLESQYARDALRQFYLLIYAGKVERCSLATFEAMTGLSLTDGSGCLKDELPPITTFLNRLLALTIAMQNVLFTVFEQLLAAKVESAMAAGTYDVGLETLVADSFTVTRSEPIYTHPATGAETRLLTIAMRERNQPVTLEKALDLLREAGARLLINTRSKRAAVQLPARSLMLDDGEVERRVRLIRPMERLNFALAHLADTNWEQVDEASFAAAWTDEITQVPEFTTSELHIVTGLLLPIWKRLPEESTRVYQLQTDDGTSIVGRRVSPAWAASATTSTDAPDLTPPQALALLREGHTMLDLADRLQLRRSRLMQVNRIELTGFGPNAVDRLKAMGLFSEIISWKLRLFVPDDLVTGSQVLERLFARHPLARIIDRMAA